MNGFRLMSESYKKAMESGQIDPDLAKKEIRIFDFLAECDQDDFCRLVDSSAVNGIIVSYMKKAVEDSGIAEKEKSRVLDQIRGIFDLYTAKEVMEQYEGA